MGVSTSAVIMWAWFLAIFLALNGLEVRGQIDIHEKSKDGYIRIPHNESEFTKEIYTSMHQLEKFFDEEKDIVEDIKMIIEKKLVSQAAVTGLGNYLASYDDVIGGQEEDETFLHNPVNVYNLVRHVAIGWLVVDNIFQDEKKAKKGQMPKRVRRVMSRSKRSHIPGETDLDGVAIGLVRLHDYYKYDLTSFITEGAIEYDNERYESNGDMTVWDAFKIGVKGANQMLLGSGLEIMLNALEKAKTDGVSVPPFVEALDMKVLRNLIKTAKTVHDQKLDRWGPRTTTHSVNPTPYDKRLAKKKKFQTVKSMPIKLNTEGAIGTGIETDMYMKLCRNIDLRPPKETKELYCKYESKNKPYYMYGPRKVEVVSLSPHIAVLHDFIMESEIKEMKSIAMPILKRSSTVGKSMNGSLSDYRVSEQTWITEEMSPNGAAKLTKRIEGFLDLEAESTEDAELYQVANYGLAGQYDVHYDQIMMTNDPASRMQKREVFNAKMGDRMTTLMGYLSDVQLGGNTVFPTVGAFVKPTRGSMVIWWNMDKAGGYDWRTRHGGCPVMVGSKWITNKWIRSNSNMFTRKCPKYTTRELRKFRNIHKYSRGGKFQDP